MTKRTNRRRSGWTPADIERAEAWWNRRDGNRPPSPVQTSTAQPAPTVPAHRSVHSEYLVCMECGERHRDLELHLAQAHGLDPVAYRRRWNLPEDYAMICPWDRMRPA